MSIAKRIGKWLVASLLAIILTTALVLSSIFGGGTSCLPSSTTISAADTSASTLLKSLGADQLKIASLVIGIGKQRGLSNKDIVIALMVGYQESRLKNVRYGDRDSLGIFQQRPSQGWGTPAQIMNPVYSTNKFYDALEDVKNRKSRSLLDIALEVQRPSRAAYQSKDNNFNSWEPLATSLLAASQKGQSVSDTTVQQASTSEQITEAASCNNSEQPVMASLTGGKLRVPVENGVINSPYGMRFHPILRYMRLHNGVDYSKPGGTPVYASAPGEISFADWQSSYGRYIQIDHGGELSTGYAHLSRIATGIRDGVQVQTGQLIGYVGTTGRSTGNHLHFVVYKNGKPVDPEPYLRK